VIAASAAYLTQRRAMLNRTRGAKAYQVGLFAGVAATIGLSNVLAAFAMTDMPIAQAGLLASFFGPFAGIVHAELRTLAEEESALDRA
jgi:FtsH-binding integral membrane protein